MPSPSETEVKPFSCKQEQIQASLQRDLRTCSMRLMDFVSDSQEYIGSVRHEDDRSVLNWHALASHAWGFAREVACAAGGCPQPS